MEVNANEIDNLRQFQDKMLAKCQVIVLCLPISLDHQTLLYKSIPVQVLHSFVMSCNIL